MVSEQREMIDYTTCMIGFKKDKFDLLKSECIDTKELMDLYEEKITKKSDKKDINEFKFSVPGIIYVLKDKTTQQKFIIANSHFYWDPRYDFFKMH